MGIVIRDGQGDHCIVRTFESISDLVAARPHPANVGHAWAGHVWAHASDASDAAWCGDVRNMADLAALLATGWPEGVERMREAIKAVEAAMGGVPNTDAIDTRRRPEYADEGDELDRDRLYSGDIDRSWRRTRRTRRVAIPSVRIWTSIEGNAGMTSLAAFWRGAVACVISDALERAGYRVEVLVYSHARGLYRKRGPSMHAVRLKGFNEALDMNRLVAGAAHVGMLRIGLFGAELSSAPTASQWSMGDADNTVPDALKDSENDIMIENVWNAAEAAKRVKAEIARLGRTTNTNV